jgi:hypothetical protein
VSDVACFFWDLKAIFASVFRNYYYAQGRWREGVNFPYVRKLGAQESYPDVFVFEEIDTRYRSCSKSVCVCFFI